MSEKFEVARHSKRLVEQQRERIAALEAERNALRAELAALKAPAVAGDEREAFESIFAGKANFARNKYHPNFYLHLTTRAMWDAWQARATRPAQTEQQPQVMGRVYDGKAELNSIGRRLPDHSPLYAAPIAQTPADGLVEALSAALIELRDAMRHYYPYPEINPPAHEAIMARADAALAAHRVGGAV